MVVDDNDALRHEACAAERSMNFDAFSCRITPLILTYDEAPNLRRTLERLAWAERVVVIDSFSRDQTEAIARSFPNVVFLQRSFDNHTAQWNHGVDQVETEWVLSLDADYVVTDEFRDEIGRLRPEADVAAYYARFRYCVFGGKLRGTLYPSRAVLFRKSRCRYVQKGHTQVLEVEGRSETLQSRILHDDRKPLARWLASQQNYARLEAEKLLRASPRELSRADRLRRWIWPAAPTVFFYTLLCKGCLLDGWPGWYYVLQRTYFELLLSLELLDRRLRGDEPSAETERESHDHDEHSRN